jgi:hypothetical protein
VKPPLTDPTQRGRNPLQWANAYAHRPEVRDLGFVFYVQVNRIRMRLKRSVERVERRKLELKRTVELEMWDAAEDEAENES